MTIEFTSAKEPKNQARLSIAIVVASCAFFFIPTTLIVLGYLTSQPTGTLISPLPHGVLSAVTPSPAPAVITVTPTLAASNSPIIAAPSDSSASSPTNITPAGGSNIIDKVAQIPAGQTEIAVTDPDIKLTSQIYLSPRVGDETIYSVKTKGESTVTISASKTSDTVRYVDYHIVSP